MQKKRKAVLSITAVLNYQDFVLRHHGDQATGRLPLIASLAERYGDLFYNRTPHGDLNYIHR